MGLYYGLLGFLGLGCAVLIKTQYDNLKVIPTTSEFERFQKVFLLVYVLATSADWIQGPYLYKLYSFYGFTKEEIGYLFVVGFCSSAVFGTLIGGLADRFGRKRTCLAFCLIYGVSCLTKHSRNFQILLFGRVMGGIATSILFSVFEAWMMHEHKRNAYPDDWLVKTFSYMTFLTSISAVLCAVLANAVTSMGGYVAPFDTAIVFLVLGAGCILRFWTENYGDQTITPGGNFAVGWVVMASNPKIWLLGFIQSCFEGAMYLFVFSWTPTLEASADDEVPHGVVFASFMVAIMIGTYIYQLALKKHSTEHIMKINAGVACFALLLPALSASHMIHLVAFCLFEVCVGVYFPAIAYLRSRNIPEEVRATVLNFFRIPLNIFVVVILLNIAHMSHETISTYCAGILFVAVCAHQVLTKLNGGQQTYSVAGNKTKEQYEEEP